MFGYNKKGSIADKINFGGKKSKEEDEKEAERSPAIDKDEDEPKKDRFNLIKSMLKKQGK
jgi:hypothetical protein